jgi:hypothetical protein
MIGLTSGIPPSWYQSQEVSSLIPDHASYSAARISHLTILTQTGRPSSPVCGWALVDSQEEEY